MPEKKYLEVSYKGMLVGAFENVTNFQETEDKSVISFNSDDGAFTYEKDVNDIYSCEENHIIFTSYRLIGRRTALKVADKEGWNSRDIDTCFTADNDDDYNDYNHSEVTGFNFLIVDNCTPTRERRKTTEEDIYRDVWCRTYDNPEELLETLIYFASGSHSGYHFENDDAPTLEKIKEVLRYFEDPGDGSKNILSCIVNGQHVEGEHPYDCLDGLDLDQNADMDEIRDAIIAEFVEDDYDY